MDWNSIKQTLKKWLRIILRRYQSEIKKYVAEQVDAQLVNLQKAISDEVRKKIKNEVMASAIEMEIDVYTSAGAETVKVLIGEYVEKLAAGGE